MAGSISKVSVPFVSGNPTDPFCLVRIRSTSLCHVWSLAEICSFHLRIFQNLASGSWRAIAWSEEWFAIVSCLLRWLYSACSGSMSFVQISSEGGICSLMGELRSLVPVQGLPVLLVALMSFYVKLFLQQVIVEDVPLSVSCSDFFCCLLQQ